MSGAVMDRDEQRLAELGYKQELSRSWSGFQNFAISFTIISILAGCFTTYGQAWNNGGPIAISWGWPLISIPILIIGFCMSELVSAYPTAGGIYWWASRLGGKGWGWAAAWFNLAGLLFVVSSVNFGVFLLFRDLFLAGVLGMDVSSWTSAAMFDTGWWIQTIFITAITVTQAPNPVPVLSSLSPASVVAGSGGVTLTVTGSGFVASSVVRWNGADRPTTFVNATQVRASLSAFSSMKCNCLTTSPALKSSTHSLGSPSRPARPVSW